MIVSILIFALLTGAAYAVGRIISSKKSDAAVVVAIEKIDKKEKEVEHEVKDSALSALVDENNKRIG